MWFIYLMHDYGQLLCWGNTLAENYFPLRVWRPEYDAVINEGGQGLWQELPIAALVNDY